MNLNVYIIIVTYNGERWIHRCLSQLFESTYPFKCIVVDNQSTDNTVDLIKDKFPDVCIINSENNLGFGKANNIGIKYAFNAGANAVFLLNQDAYIDKNTISELVAHFDENVLLSPLQYRGDGNEFDFGFRRYLNIYAPEYFIDAEVGSIKPTYEVSFVNAAAWFIPLSLIKEVGLFDPLFDHYGEDENYAHRVIYRGYKIKVVPSSVICHDRKQNVQRKVDFRYLKTYMLVSALNPLKAEIDIIEFDYSYWPKLFCYSLLDLICGRIPQFKDKMHLISYFINHKKELRNHRNMYQSSGSFL